MPDPATTPRTFGELYALKIAADADAQAKAEAAAMADQAALDARGATETINATMRSKLKKPFFVANPDGSIVIVTPDTSELGFHFFSPDAADTPLDEAPAPGPGPTPEPAPGPAPEPAPAPA